MKLCVLGFDGFDSELFESCNLPNIKWLRENGQWGTLFSPSMKTGPAWTSILTGWRIETHGITHLLGYPRDGSTWFLARPRDYIFDVLHNHGFRVGVANFPSLVYSREIGDSDYGRSWMMAGWPKKPVIRSSFTALPNIELPEMLYSDLPDFEERFLADDWRKPKGALPDWAIHEIPWNEYMQFAYTNAHLRLDFIQRKLFEVDILMVQESVCDRGGHTLSTPNKGKLGTEDPRYNHVLELVDSLINRIRIDYNPDYLSIVSDHGFQGISEADPETGCWHSRRGVWAIVGEGIEKIRNNTNQVNYTPTILDVLGIQVERDGQSAIYDFSDVEQRLKGLGYS